jgi:hypothetical protein
MDIDFRKKKLPINMANVPIFGRKPDLLGAELVQQVLGRVCWQRHRSTQTLLKKYIELAQEKIRWDDEDIE